MSDGVLSGQPGFGLPDGGATGTSAAATQGQFWARELFPLATGATVPLLIAAAVVGLLADALLRSPDGPGLNWALIVASVSAAAVLLHRRTARGTGARLHTGRVAWLATGVAFAAGLAWRSSGPLHLLALVSSIVAFALAAHRRDGSWVRRAGVSDYGAAVGLGALHTWMAGALVVADAVTSASRRGDHDTARFGHAAAIARGLVVAAPLVGVFAALFMSADAVFSTLVMSAVRVDVEAVVGHTLLFSIFTWWAAGYLRAFLTGTTPALPQAVERHVTARPSTGPALGITEVATALASLDLLFVAFVFVQFRYLFGGDHLVQVTVDLTYAEYARRGFFELVFAVMLVVPVLLAADWLLERRTPRDTTLFRFLAGLQIALVLAITASASMRLWLYYASYGLTASRLYAMVLLVWVASMLLWLAATVLRGRRESFGFGALVTGLATAAVLFVANPEAIVARSNVARLVAAGPSRFDVTYATQSLSADAVPVLIDALPQLTDDARCRLARRMLAAWPPEHQRSLRSWNWSSERAATIVRERATPLRSMLRPDGACDTREDTVVVATTPVAAAHE